MSVAVIGTIPGMTIKHYDEVMDQVADHMWEQGVMHFCHKHGDGLRMIEIWPDREKLDHFLGMVGPFLKKEGLKADIEIIPVHNHFHPHKAHK